MKKTKTMLDVLDKIGCCYYDLVLKRFSELRHLPEKDVQEKLKIDGAVSAHKISMHITSRVIHGRNIRFTIDLVKIKADVSYLVFSDYFDTKKSQVVKDAFKSGVREFVQLNISGYDVATNTLVYSNGIPFTRLISSTDELLAEFVEAIKDEVEYSLDKTLKCYIEKGVEYHSNYLMMQHGKPDIDGILQSILKK